MYILRPSGTNGFNKDVIGTIEEIVRDARLVDPGLVELEPIKKNAPLNELNRREFLVYGAKTVGKLIASLAGVGLLSQSTSSCAHIGASIRRAAEKDWELYLLKQDWIRGPGLILGRNGLPNDWKNHVDNPFNQGWGAVDYSVPIGTPIVPAANAYSLLFDVERGNIGLILLHSGVNNSRYYHLDGVTEVINQGKEVVRRGPSGRSFSFRDQNLNKLTVIGFSGNSGIGPEGRAPQPQLHFDLRNYKAGTVSLDPFKLGIDADKKVGKYGGRVVYGNGRTAIIHTPSGRAKWLQHSMGNLERRVKQSSLDKETKDEILKRSNNPIELRDYLGMRVLQKKRDDKGNFNYEFTPDSFMYALMLEFYGRTSKQEFIAMLPFPYPGLKHIYQKANPGVQL